nr:MAG TPA: hypothetical protein [Caudoviricetes sp.]
MNVIIHIRFSNFIRSTGFLGLGGNLRFSGIQGGGRSGYGLCESAKRHQGQSGNSGQSFYVFHD